MIVIAETAIVHLFEGSLFALLIKLVTLAPCTPTPLTAGVEGAITAGTGIGLAVKVVVMPCCCKTCVMHACNTCYMSTRQAAMCTLTRQINTKQAVCCHTTDALRKATQQCCRFKFVSLPKFLAEASVSSSRTITPSCCTWVQNA